MCFSITKSVKAVIVILLLWTVRHIVGKAKHYKFWLSCIVLQIALFTTFSISVRAMGPIAFLFVLWGVFLLSDWADIKVPDEDIEPNSNKRSFRDITIWNPENESDNIAYNNLIVKRIKEYCLENNISYYKLAKDSGLPKSTLMSYLNRTNPSTSTLVIKKICDGLGLCEYEFFDHKYFKTQK